MKNLLLIFCLMIITIFHSISQVAEVAMEFESLQVNSAPAFNILGVEPENIQRPNSPKEFIANVQSSLVNGILQPNFAMETNPYLWLQKNSDEKAFSAYDYVVSNNYWNNLAQTLSFSVASSQTDTFTLGTLPKGTGVGLGFRVQLFQGKMNKTNYHLLKDILNYIDYSNILYQIFFQLNRNKIDDLDLWLLKFFNEHPEYSIYKEADKNYLKSEVMSFLHTNSLDSNDRVRIKNRIDYYYEESNNKAKVLNSYIYPLTREGFVLELAISNAEIFANSSWDSIYNAKTSIWITPSYRINCSPQSREIKLLDIMAVMRGTFNNKAVDSSNYFDLGTKVQFIYNRVSISGEYIYRYASKIPDNISKNYTYKLGLNFNYKFNDLVTFTTSIGSGFDGNTSLYDEPQPLIIVGGFNFGLSKLK